MDLIHGTYDLSRRGKLFKLHGMSFREYLEFRTGSSIPVVCLGDVIDKKMKPVSLSIEHTGHIKFGMME